jgi:SpoVK/Ycf46/Vps4 family AAA+-type ATPase
MPADIPERLSAYLAPSKIGNLDDIWAELEALIGLPQVKQKVRSIVNSIKVQQLRDESSQLVPGHYLFIGNPGTGKTSVAQLMGRLFYALGLLRKGHLVEAGRTDLTGSPMQSSTTQTRQIVHKSLDGVLFIDDAHQLIQSEYDEMGREAVKALLNEMEKHRDRLCVILAGYPDSMAHFIQLMPSVTARIAADIRFENYQPEALLAIFQQMVAAHKLQLAEALPPALLTVFQEWTAQASPNFGNAHEVRRLLDEMITQQNNRLVETGALDHDSLYQLTLADLEAVLS